MCVCRGGRGGGGKRGETGTSLNFQKTTQQYTKGKSPLFITRDDVVSQRLKFGSAFLSSSWESKIAFF